MRERACSFLLIGGNLWRARPRAAGHLLIGAHVLFLRATPRGVHAVLSGGQGALPSSHHQTRKRMEHSAMNAALSPNLGPAPGLTLVEAPVEHEVISRFGAANVHGVAPMAGGEFGGAAPGFHAPVTPAAAAGCASWAPQQQMNYALPLGNAEAASCPVPPAYNCWGGANAAAAPSYAFGAATYGTSPPNAISYGAVSAVYGGVGFAAQPGLNPVPQFAHTLGPQAEQEQVRNQTAYMMAKHQHWIGQQEQERKQQQGLAGRDAPATEAAQPTCAGGNAAPASAPASTPLSSRQSHGLPRQPSPSQPPPPSGTYHQERHRAPASSAPGGGGSAGYQTPKAAAGSSKGSKAASGGLWIVCEACKKWRCLPLGAEKDVDPAASWCA